MAIGMLKYLTDNGGVLTPTVAQIDQYIRHTAMYEARDQHAQAFNSPFLAVNKAYFFPKDADVLFDTFNFDPRLMAAALKEAIGIHDTTHVIRDNFNMATLWVSYCVLQSEGRIPKKKVEEGRFSLFKMLHYKFFTGKVNRMFPHGANEAVMEATIDGLSLKCDIKNPETPTWKLIIEDHCRQLLDERNIHGQALKTFQPDNKVGYVLSNSQTRLSSKIVNVAVAYYENHKNQNKISDSEFVMTDQDGEKIIKGLRASLDAAIARICTNVLNINSFINFEDVKLVCKLVPAVRTDMLRSVLTIFSNMAYTQYRNKLGDEVKIDKANKQQLYVGYRVLITELIQKTYRHCIMSGVKPDSHIGILNKTRDTYRASRIANPDILTIKDSVDLFVTTNTKYTREATLISIRTAFILYIIIMSFK